MRSSKRKLGRKFGYVALLGVMMMPHMAQAASFSEAFVSNDFVKAETPVYDVRAAGGNRTAAYVRVKSCSRPSVGVKVWIPNTNCGKYRVSNGDVKYLRNNAPVGSMIKLAVESGDGDQVSASGVWSPNNTSGHK